MQFTCNTKPLMEALNLGVINANVSNYNKKSNLAQLSATKSQLKINLEAANICTELKLRGSGDEESGPTIFVSSLLLKQLVATLETAVVTIEFREDGIVIHSGKSKFTLPKMLDAGELTLTAPVVADYSTDAIPINQADWKFIKDNQMFAIAMSFIHPVYTRVWIGESGDVIVGDIDNSLFTHSKKSKLGNTCLLSDTIINLFTCLPDGAKLHKLDRDYIVECDSDSFSYISQFTPLYEADEGVGSYNSDIFLSTMEHGDTSISVSTVALNKFLSQASLLSSTLDDTIVLTVSGNTLTLADKNVDCKLDVVGNDEQYQLEFRTESLRKVIANYTSENINISVVITEDEPSGLLIWDEALTTLIASVAE